LFQRADVNTELEQSTSTSHNKESQICKICFCTSKSATGECLVCKQNDEFQASLAADQQIASSSTGINHDENTVDENPLDENPISLASLRRRRVEAIEGYLCIE